MLFPNGRATGTGCASYNIGYLSLGLEDVMLAKLTDPFADTQPINVMDGLGDTQKLNLGDLAFEVDSPYVFEPSETPVSAPTTLCWRARIACMVGAAAALGAAVVSLII